MKGRISQVARGINAINPQRMVDAAKILGMNLVCLHTVCDNLAAKFLKEKVEKKPERIEDLVDSLKEIPEYKKAMKIVRAGLRFLWVKKQTLWQNCFS